MCSGSVVECSDSVVVATPDYESSRPDSSPDLVGANMPQGSITAHGLSEPSELYIGARAAEHRGSNWGMRGD